MYWNYIMVMQWLSKHGNSAIPIPIKPKPAYCISLNHLMYNSPIGEIIEKHSICYHLYADDGQLDLAFSPKDSLSQDEAKEKMMKCAKDVKSFLTFNKMKQNDDKTEFLIIGTTGQLKKVNFKYIHICEADVSSSEQARNLWT